MPSLRSLINEAEELKKKAITQNCVPHSDWYKKTKEFITNNHISYLKEFNSIGFKSIGRGIVGMEADVFVEGVNRAIGLLQRIKQNENFLSRNRDYLGPAATLIAALIALFAVVINKTENQSIVVEETAPKQVHGESEVTAEKNLKK